MLITAIVLSVLLIVAVFGVYWGFFRGDGSSSSNVDSTLKLVIAVSMVL